MKKRNSLVLRRALTGFSVLVILFSHGTAAFASVDEGVESIAVESSEVVNENQGDASGIGVEVPSQTLEAEQPVVSEATPIETPAVEPPLAEVPTEETPVVVDKTNLQAKTDELAQVLANPERYTSTSLDIATASQLLTQSQGVLSSEAASSAEVESCAENIAALLAKLVLRGDKSPLQALVTTAEGFVEGDYTPASYSVFTNALIAARQLLADPDALADGLASSLANLQGAINGLVKKEVPTPETPKPEVPEQEKPEAEKPEAEKPKPEVPEKQTPDQPEKTEKPEETTPEKPITTTPEANQSSKESITNQQTTDKSVGESSDADFQQSNLAPSTEQAAMVETNSGDDSVNQLDTSYAVDSLTNSDLNGFELPLLSSFTDQRQAALIAQGLKTLSLPYNQEAVLPEDGTLPESFNNLNLPQYLYSSVVGVNLGVTYDEMAKSGEKVALDELQPGDLLFWQEEEQPARVAMYLQDGKYLMADESVVSQDVTVPSLDEEKVLETDGDTKEAPIPGVRIYTLQGYSKDENGEVTIASADNAELPEEITSAYDRNTNPDFAVHVLADNQLTTVGEELLSSYGASIDFRKNPVTESFIASIAEDARELGLQYDVYASVMIAQAILETGSGSSSLSKAPYYNLFGIKGLYNGNSVSMNTMEDDGTGNLYQITAAFRNYPNLRASLTDYISLVRQGTGYDGAFYKGVWRSEAKNYLQATEFLTGRYATDTSYNNKLNSIIAAYHLTQYDEPRVADESIIITGRDAIPSAYAEKMVFPDYNGVNYNVSGSYPVGQCTWYVFNRITQLGGTVDDFMGNGGEWGQRGASLGYRTTQTPTVGYAVSFHPGVASSSKKYGHVAFVEAVSQEGILVSEGNVVGPTTVSYRVIPNRIARSNQVTYVAPK